MMEKSERFVVYVKKRFKKDVMSPLHIQSEVFLKEFPEYPTDIELEELWVQHKLECPLDFLLYMTVQKQVRFD